MSKGCVSTRAHVRRSLIQKPCICRWRRPLRRHGLILRTMLQPITFEMRALICTVAKVADAAQRLECKDRVIGGLRRSGGPTRGRQGLDGGRQSPQTGTIGLSEPGQRFAPTREADVASDFESVASCPPGATDEASGITGIVAKDVHGEGAWPAPSHHQHKRPNVAIVHQFPQVTQVMQRHAAVGLGLVAQLICVAHNELQRFKKSNCVACAIRQFCGYWLHMLLWTSHAHTHCRQR